MTTSTEHDRLVLDYLAGGRWPGATVQAGSLTMPASARVSADVLARLHDVVPLSRQDYEALGCVGDHTSVAVVRRSAADLGPGEWPAALASAARIGGLVAAQWLVEVVASDRPMTVRESALDWIDVLAAGDHPQALAGGRVPVDLGARPVWQSCHHHGVSTPETALVQALEDVRLKSRGFWKSAVQDVQETVLVGLKAVMMESLRTAGHGGNAVDDMMRALNGLEQSWEAYEREVEDQLWTGASAPPQVTPPSLQAEPLDPFSAP